MNTHTVIEADRVNKYYGATRVVRDISFRIQRGQVSALLGSNGAGKTTILAILLGLVTPSSGQVQILGEDMLRHRYRVLPRMNFFSPYVDLPRRLRVRENLEIYARLYGIWRPRRRISDLSAQLGCEELLPRIYGTLSAGQKTRVALVKALLNEPELLLLDEPTASLDPDAAEHVRSCLLQYTESRQATILLASHNMPEVERICQHVLIMRDGRIFDSGSPAELIQRHGHQDLEQTFLQLVRRDLEP